MVNAVLPGTVIINNTKYNDVYNLTTAELNQRMSTNNAYVSRPVFYAQWALFNAGFYNGPINGIVGSTNALFDAFTALYNQQYSGPDYVAPANKQVTFKFFAAVIRDQSEVDTNVYKVVS